MTGTPNKFGIAWQRGRLQTEAESRGFPWSGLQSRPVLACERNSKWICWTDTDLGSGLRIYCPTRNAAFHAMMTALRQLPERRKAKR